MLAKEASAKFVQETTVVALAQERNGLLSPGVMEEQRFALASRRQMLFNILENQGEHKE